MKNRKYIFLFLMIFMFVFSLSAVSADDFNTTESGTVSGDMDVTTENPGTTSGELKYDIPSEAKEIKSAKVYVNVYSGSAKNTYGANANVTLKTKDKEEQIGNESLWIEEGTMDGTVYRVNNHTNKCYSDYQMYYDITDSLNGLNGTSISIKVNTYEMLNKSFDGRIKLIALTLAYNDGDDDKISYWIDSAQHWTKTTMTTPFNTAEVENYNQASLTNIALSSTDGSYQINGNYLGDAEVHESGFYYKYNYWNITDEITKGKNTTFNSNSGTGEYSSLKNVLTVLKIKKVNINDIKSNVSSITTEYNYKGQNNACYAGTNNIITININTNKNGTYLIELLANGNIVSTKKVYLNDGKVNNINITDPTIRSIDETTVNGAINNKVDYTAKIKYQDYLINSTTLTVPVLYNGYLGKSFEYNATYMENFKNIEITGDIFIDIQNGTTYLTGANTNRTDIWNINLDKDSTFANAFTYIAYNWDKTTGTNGPELNITFNGEKIKATYHFRDQSNLGSSGKYGYGLYIYDISKLIKNGENTLTLNKTKDLTVIYPSTLIYLTNKTNSDIIKTVYIANGADLLSNSYNDAGRVVNSEYTLNTNTKDLNDATLYVFAAGAQTNEGNIIFNSEEYINIWNGTDKTTNLYTKDITKTIKDSNKISFVATGGTILALQQIIVTTTNKTKPTPTPSPAPSPSPSTTPTNEKVTTKKVASKITAKKTTTFKAKTKVKKYTITLKAGKKAIKKVKVTIKIKGKTYSARTNAKGKAIFKIKKLTKKGKYIAVIKFKGNKSYKAFTKKVKIIVK